MVCDRIIVNEFHGIPFKGIPGLSTNLSALPNGLFYKRLYQEVDRLAPVSELFLSGTRDKAEIVAELVKRRFPGRKDLKILSWGAGLGMVEGILSREHGWTVHATEFNRSTRYWPPDVQYFSALANVPAENRYDIVMELSTFTVMEMDWVEEACAVLSQRLAPGGLFIAMEWDARSIFGACRSYMKSQLFCRYRRGFQKWGYLRSPDEYAAVFQRHFASLEILFLSRNQDWSTERMTPPMRIAGRQIFRQQSKAQIHVCEARNP